MQEVSILESHICALQLVSSGADGLLKLWSVGSSECINTFDAHEGKVWALDSHGVNDKHLISGGADGALVVWQDITATRQAEKAHEAAQSIENQQALSNALQVRSRLITKADYVIRYLHVQESADIVAC